MFIFYQVVYDTYLPTQKNMAGIETLDAYFLFTGSVESVYLVTSDFLKKQKPSSDDDRIQGHAGTLRAAMLGEFMIPWIRDVRYGTILTKESVTTLARTSRRVIESKVYLERLPFSLPEARNELPEEVYNFRDAKGLGEGAFGCVIRMPILEDQRVHFGGKKEIAIKFQLVRSRPKPGFETLLSQRTLAEMYAASSASNMNDYPKTNPFSLRVYRYYEANITKEVFRVLNPMIKRECSKQFRMPSRPVTTEKLRVIETDLVPGGSLANITQTLSSREVASLAFQMIYSMMSMQRLFRLVHNDIKPENVLFEDVQHSPRNIRIHADGTNFLLPLGTKENPRIVFISDFGTATSDQFTDIDFFSDKEPARKYEAGSPAFLPPDLWLYYDILEAEEDQHLPPRDIASDLWATGITLITLTLNGWDLSASGYDASKWPALEETGGIFQNYIPHVDVLDSPDEEKKRTKPLANFLFEESKKSRKVGRTERPGQKEGQSTHLIGETVVSTVFAMVRFQEAIGNAFPVHPDKGYTFGHTYQYIRANKTAVDAVGDNWKKTPKPKDVNIFDAMAQHLETRLGNHGMDFLRKCLAWSYTDRLRFASSVNGALGHAFLAHLKRDAFDYTPARVATQDYFLF